MIKKVAEFITLHKNKNHVILWTKLAAGTTGREKEDRRERAAGIVVVLVVLLLRGSHEPSIRVREIRLLVSFGAPLSIVQTDAISNRGSPWHRPPSFHYALVLASELLFNESRLTSDFL